MQSVPSHYVRHLLNTCISSDLVISHLEMQNGIVEFVLLEMLMHVATGLMPNVASGRCEQRRNHYFCSFFCTRIGTCVDSWGLHDNFENLTMPARFLGTLMLLKERSTEEENATRVG